MIYVTNLAIKRSDVNLHKIIVYLANDINDLDDYYIVFDTKNRNTELDTLYIWSLLWSEIANFSLLNIKY